MLKRKSVVSNEEKTVLRKEKYKAQKKYDKLLQESSVFQRQELKQVPLHVSKKGHEELLAFSNVFKEIYRMCIDIHKDYPQKEEKRKMIVNKNGSMRKDHFSKFATDHLEQGINEFHKNLNAFNAKNKKKKDKAQFILDNIEAMEDYKRENGIETMEERLKRLENERKVAIQVFKEKSTRPNLSFSQLDKIRVENEQKSIKFNIDRERIVNWKARKTKYCKETIEKLENVSFKPKEEDIMSFPIKHRFFNTSTFKKRIGLSKDVEITKDTRIIYNNVKRFWYIIQYKVSDVIDGYNGNGHIIALDPGVRTFQTTLSTNGNKVFYGHEHRQFLRKSHKKIDKIKSIEDSNTKRRRGRLKKRRERTQYKIKNCTRELHYQCIKDMLNDNDIVLLPQYDSSRLMVELDHKDTKRENASLEHYKFKQRLIHKANQKSKKVLIVNERNSTKTCFNCKHVHKRGEIKGKVFTCRQCGIESSRDMNACKNIMFMNIDKIVETLVPHGYCSRSINGEGLESTQSANNPNTP